MSNMEIRVEKGKRKCNVIMERLAINNERPQGRHGVRRRRKKCRESFFFFFQLITNALIYVMHFV